MSCLTSIRVVSCVALLCLMFTQTSRARPVQDDLPSYILAQHRVVLQKWLKQRSNFRPATAQDMDQELLKRIKDMFPKEVERPFYSVGDFNHDGQKDFAIGLINKNSSKTLAIAVFNGPFGRTGASAPAFYNANRFELSDLFFISLDNRNRDLLQIGLGSDLRTVFLKPKGKGYYIWVGATE